MPTFVWEYLSGLVKAKDGQANSFLKSFQGKLKKEKLHT